MAWKMKRKTNDLVVRNSIFFWIALAVVAVLLIPFFAMQFTNEVNWTKADFIVMGSLLFGMASLFVFVARKSPRRHRTLIAVIFLAVFVYVWAELAVGVFTNLGS
jgi:peptidoglycan/LPS O-acetylase OafA/YrhL